VGPDGVGMSSPFRDAAKDGRARGPSLRRWNGPRKRMAARPSTGASIVLKRGERHGATRARRDTSTSPHQTVATCEQRPSGRREPLVRLLILNVPRYAASVKRLQPDGPSEGTNARNGPRWRRDRPRNGPSNGRPREALTRGAHGETAPRRAAIAPRRWRVSGCRVSANRGPSLPPMPASARMVRDDAA